MALSEPHSMPMVQQLVQRVLAPWRGDALQFAFSAPSNASRQVLAGGRAALEAGTDILKGVLVSLHTAGLQRCLLRPDWGLRKFCGVVWHWGFVGVEIKHGNAALS